MSRFPLRVIYVASSSHSGSTLLALLADGHAGVASVGETAVKPGIRRQGRAALVQCSCGVPLGQCPFWIGLFRRVSAAGIPFGETCWSNDYRFDSTWLDAVFTRETSLTGLRVLRRWASRHLPGYRRRVARIDRANVAFIGAVLAQTGAAVFVDTTKLVTRLSHLLLLPELDIRVVHLVRDARGVAASGKRRGVPVEQSARIWRNDQLAIEHVIRTLPEERTMQMRYEDLCSAPRETLERMWDFCGLEPGDAPVSVRPAAHHVIGNRMRLGDMIQVRLDDSWRTTLGDRDERRILAIAGSLNRRLGYL